MRVFDSNFIFNTVQLQILLQNLLLNQSFFLLEVGDLLLQIGVIRLLLLHEQCNLIHEVLDLWQYVFGNVFDPAVQLILHSPQFVPQLLDVSLVLDH